MDTSRLYKKLTKKQALNKIVDRIKSMIDSDKWGDRVFLNMISDTIKFPRDLEMMYDSIYYSVSDSDLPVDKLASHIDKGLHTMSLNLEGYFVSKYQLDSLLITMVANPDVVDMDMITKGYTSLIYNMNCLIELCLFRTDKRTIRGVDITTNTIKYTSANTMFDLMAINFKNELDIPFYREAFTATEMNYLRTSGNAFVSPEALTSIFDKVDDCMRIHNDSCILVDIINQKLPEKVQFAKPSREIVEAILYTGAITAVPNMAFRQRTCMTGINGNLILNKKSTDPKYGISSVLIKDILLANNPFIAVSYKTNEGVEDTVIIPLHFDAVIQTVYVEAIALTMDFYGVTFFEDKMLDYEVISPYYWRYRNKGYVTERDKVSSLGKVTREYKEIEIGIHKAKLGNASDKAKALAKLHCIELKDGETIVDTHIRHYGVKGKEVKPYGI